MTLEVGKNRMEALGEVQETADFFNVYCDSFEAQGGFDHVLPNDPLPNVVSRNRSVMKPYGVWVVINPFNFPFALAGGPGGRGARHRQHGGAQGRERNAMGRAIAGRLPARCRIAAGRLQLPDGAGRRDRRGARGASADRGVTFTGSYETGMGIVRKLAAGRYPKPCIAEMGGKNACVVTANADLETAAAGIVRSAFGMGGQKCSALSRLYVEESRRGRADCKGSSSGCRRSASAIRRARRTGWVR